MIIVRVECDGCPRKCIETPVHGVVSFETFVPEGWTIVDARPGKFVKVFCWACVRKGHDKNL